MPHRFDMPVDYALVGGGLQNGLLALAIRHHQPNASIVLVERAQRLGGNHTWCLHDGDVTAAAMAWLAPLITHRWSGYSVHFERLSRQVAMGYAAITSEQLHEVVQAAVQRGPGAVWLGTTAVAIGNHDVTLADGRLLRARHVVCALGPERAEVPTATGWQKFVGLEIETQSPHGLTQPILMDARVPQIDGLRFVYTLPFGAKRLLVEDTVFSDNATLRVDAMRSAALGYARTHGWQVAAIMREEHGVLPMPWGESPPLPPQGPLLAGMQGGWFHPATGYSLAVAARLADCVARQGDLATLRARHARQARFARKLNWALFRMAEPRHRNSMMSRFYRRPDEVIRRFFALDLHPTDAWRIVLGAPPRQMNWWPRTIMQEASP